jgi:hypothetical protein
MTTTAALLLVALLVAHDLGDFTPLATARIREAKANGGPMGPILAHAAVHAVLVGVAVLLVARPTGALLAAAVGLEFSSHFVIDAARARMGVWMPSLGDMRSNVFWWALGVDQLLHGLVLIGITVLVMG